MNKITSVRIHDLGYQDPLVYDVSSREDCHDSVDMEVYDLVVKFEDVITMGCITGEPIWEEIP